MVMSAAQHPDRAATYQLWHRSNTVERSSCV